jgi:diguanylate cyclase (GGDEF)-like protein
VIGGAKVPYLIVISGPHVGELYRVAKQRTVIGRAPDADIRIIDEGVSREHVELFAESDRVVIRDLGSTNGTFRNGSRVAVDDVADGDKICIGTTTILKFSYQDGVDEAYEQRLYRSAVLDATTSAMKRDYFMDRLDGEIAYSTRHQSPVALILWDVDRFKAVNDRFGHPVGDRILEATSRTVSALIRREDVFGRYGGEEFALACRATTIAAAMQTAERLREAIAGTVVSLDSGSLSVTASFGVACCPADGITRSAELIAAADGAMYQAKAAGRNRVVAAATGPRVLDA